MFHFRAYCPVIYIKNILYVSYSGVLDMLLGNDSKQTGSQSKESTPNNRGTVGRGILYAMAVAKQKRGKNASTTLEELYFLNDPCLGIIFKIFLADAIDTATVQRRHFLL
jgi:hypothetical protein